MFETTETSGACLSVVGIVSLEDAVLFLVSVDVGMDVNVVLGSSWWWWCCFQRHFVGILTFTNDASGAGIGSSL